MCFNNFFSKKEKLKTVSTINDNEFISLQAQLLDQINMTPSPKILFGQEKNTVQFIKEKTAFFNKNNITRTKAYLDFYLRNPEVHWAFLAHMVSRNGGWSMTDLKGSLIGRLMPVETVEIFFEFLEKANANIFHDAYPQLLLYEESKKTGRNLFHLLPLFSVSRFMEPIWNYFWTSNNSELLTIGLIINEQNYIQKRLIENTFYKENVLHTVLYQAQELLGFTDVFFPYFKKGTVQLAGLTIHRFVDLQTRITVGKRLYGILFNHIYKKAFGFAKKIPHSGSRSDYWPDVFSKEKNYQSKIYSPVLTDVWHDYQHTFNDGLEWFTNSNSVELLTNYKVPNQYEMTKEYKEDLEKLQFIQDLQNLLS